MSTSEMKYEYVMELYDDERFVFGAERSQRSMCC